MPPTRAKIPTRLNTFLFFNFAFAQAYLLFIFPWVFRQLPGPALALLGLSVLGVLPAWYLIHEAVHDHLHSNVIADFAMGRVLSVLCGVPLSGIRVAHLLHHRFNRIEEFAEHYDPEKDSWLTTTGKYLFLILGGLYWVEILGGLATILPRRARLALGDHLAGENKYMKRVYQGMNQPKTRERILVESLAIAAGLTASFMLYGPELRVILILALGTRAFLISFFDNSFHYDTPRNPGDNSEGTRNHSLPAAWLILNFNYHATHHRHPGAPWNALPSLALQDGSRFEGNYFRRAAAQLRGALVDPPRFLK